jgi:hypothetical protein
MNAVQKPLTQKIGWRYGVLIPFFPNFTLSLIGMARSLERRGLTRRNAILSFVLAASAPHSFYGGI